MKPLVNQILICSNFLMAIIVLTGCGVTTSRKSALVLNSKLETPAPSPTSTSGLMDLASYQLLAKNYSLAAGIIYRYGSPAAVNNTGVPTQYLPPDKTFDNGYNVTWPYQVAGPQDVTKDDFFTAQGQILFVPDQTSSPGIDVIQQAMMGQGTFSEKPMLSWTYYGGGSPDPDLSKYTSVIGGVPARLPTAIGRSYGFQGWGSNDLVGFQSGLIAAFGENTARGSASIKLPSNKLPTAITLTSNNEFALVSVWDTNLQKGQVAVLALGTGNSFWGDWAAVYPGLRNRGLFTFIKLLGYIDLPGMTQPTEITSANDFAATLDSYQGWLFSPDGTNGRYHEEQLTLTNETNRQSFITGKNATRYAKSGFAVVISKAEKKAIFLDLKPLFDQFSSQYFTSQANFSLTQNLGMADNQWPYAFSVAPQSMPVVVKSIGLSETPSAVRANIVPGVNQVYIGTQEGNIHIISVGNYGTTSSQKSPNDIQEVGSVYVGSNPTSIAYAKNIGWGKPDTLGNQLIVAVRGERAIKWVQLSGNGGSILKTLRDTRMIDPISVEDCDTHGTEAPLVTVTDYNGKQMLNYRYGAVVFHTNGGATFGIGGGGQFEHGGAYHVAGHPFLFSGNNVP